MGLEDEAVDVLDLVEEVEDQDEPENPEQQVDEPGDDDEVIGASFEGEQEEPPAQAERETSLVKHLRQQLKEKDKLLRQASPVQKIDVGKKPDLWEDCEGDPDKFEAELLAYNKRVADAKAQSDEAEKANAASREIFAADHAEYQQQKAKLPNFEVAEAAIESSLSEVQQSVLILAAKNKAALIQALSKSPARLAELAKIQHPVKLAVAIAEMERGLKVQVRRKGVEPEERMRGTASMSADARTKKRNAIIDKMGKGGDITALRAELRALDAG